MENAKKTLTTRQKELLNEYVQKMAESGERPDFREIPKKLDLPFRTARFLFWKTAKFMAKDDGDVAESLKLRNEDIRERKRQGTQKLGARSLLERKVASLEKQNKLLVSRVDSLCARLSSATGSKCPTKKTKL